MAVTRSGPPKRHTGAMDETRQAELTTSVLDVFRTEWQPLVRFAATVSGPSAAQDVVADVFSTLSTGHPPQADDLRAYCYRSVYNRAIDETRRQRRNRRRLDRLSLDFIADQRRHHSGFDETEFATANALLTLSNQQRAVVYLAYWEDRSPPQIATTLGLSEGSVRKQLARARKRLRAELGGPHDR